MIKLSRINLLRCGRSTAFFSRIYIAKIESGKRLPSLEVLDRLAAALNTSIAGIVEAMDEPGRLQPSCRDRSLEEIEALLRGCSKGQLDLARHFIALIKRYSISEK